MAPYMIESADAYQRCARVLWKVDGRVAMINACLSVEILLKSFNVEVAALKGDRNERYKMKSGFLKRKDKHDLVYLFEELPDQVKSLFEREIYDLKVYLNKYRSVFKSGRYEYEPDAYVGSTTTIIDVAETLVKETAKLYYERGNRDPFIKSMHEKRRKVQSDLEDHVRILIK